MEEWVCYPSKVYMPIGMLRRIRMIVEALKCQMDQVMEWFTCSDGGGGGDEIEVV